VKKNEEIDLVVEALLDSGLKAAPDVGIGKGARPYRQDWDTTFRRPGFAVDADDRGAVTVRHAGKPVNERGMLTLYRQALTSIGYATRITDDWDRPGRLVVTTRPLDPA
jgi:hypothetical protein